LYLEPEFLKRLENKITVVAASDNHYAILLAALLKSIEQNHKTGELIDFYVIDDGVSQKNKDKIGRSLDPGIIRVTWCKSQNVVPTGVSLPVDHTAFPLTTYLRLFAPYIVPEDAQKVIYLDVDMIVCADISNLWHTDIGEYLFAAVQDLGKIVGCSWGGIPNYKELGMEADWKYFNAGLLVINPVRWRQLEITKKVLQAMYDNMKHVNYADQYGLNVALVNQWFQLDDKWNWFATEEQEDPYIIHFLDIKPTFKSYRSQPRFKDEFYKYLNQTEWRGFKPVSGYNRLVRKAYNKIKKRTMRLLGAKN
jgi:lipopolysaccharide biosynthesis glycosyltransferase